MKGAASVDARSPRLPATLAPSAGEVFCFWTDAVNVFITGGSSFLGRNLIRACGDRVLVLARRWNAAISWPSYLPHAACMRRTKLYR